jgi:hypothetical protein
MEIGTKDNPIEGAFRKQFGRMEKDSQRVVVVVQNVGKWIMTNNWKGKKLEKVRSMSQEIYSTL